MRIFKVLLRQIWWVVAAVMFLIGLVSIPEDLASWQELLEPLAMNVSPPIAVFIVFISIGIFAFLVWRDFIRSRIKHDRPIQGHHLQGAVDATKDQIGFDLEDDEDTEITDVEIVDLDFGVKAKRSKGLKVTGGQSQRV